MTSFVVKGMPEDLLQEAHEGNEEELKSDK